MKLSVVITARNDDYGGNFLERLRKCYYSLQSLIVRPDYELIIVEWNPPSNTLPLYDVIGWDRNVKIITVSNEVSKKLLCESKLQFAEYIAKNVGIRRAEGEFVLSTNADIIFSVSMLQRLSSEFSKEKFYRADRHDINEREEIVVVYTGKENEPHYEASGDFMLMAKEKWMSFKGYLEFPDQIHLDSLMVYEALKSGMQQEILREPIFHQQHDRPPLPMIEFNPELLLSLGKSENWGLKDDL